MRDLLTIVATFTALEVGLAAGSHAGKEDMVLARQIAENASAVIAEARAIRDECAAVQEKRTTAGMREAQRARSSPDTETNLAPLWARPERLE